MIEILICVLKGKEIIKLYNITPGPVLGLILQDILEWQILHPFSDKQELTIEMDNIILQSRK